MTKTVGEVFDERGPCLIMAKVAEIAEAIKRIPVGRWDYTFASDSRWRLCLNGGTDVWTPPGLLEIPRFEGVIARDGWPVATFNTVGGMVVGRTEDDIIEALECEVRAVTP